MDVSIEWPNADLTIQSDRGKCVWRFFLPGGVLSRAPHSSRGQDVGNRMPQTRHAHTHGGELFSGMLPCQMCGQHVTFPQVCCLMWRFFFHVRLRSDSPSETGIGDKMRVCTATICFETRVGDRMRMCAADFVRNRRRALVTAFMCVCIAAISSESGIYRSNGNSGHGWCVVNSSSQVHVGRAGGSVTGGPSARVRAKARCPKFFLQKNLREVGAFIRIFTKSSGDNLRETFRDNVVLRFPL